MSIRRRARSSLPGLFLVLVVLAAPPLQAQEGVFTVSAIAVDASAETAAQARDAAIAQGQFAALQKLFQRLVVREDQSRLPLPMTDQLAEYVQDFSVANERSSAGRYLADFTVRFKPAAMRALFQQHGVRYAEVQSKPIVVVPVFGPKETAVLWQEPNPWRAAWAAERLDEGLVPFLIPLGDLSDMTAIGAEQALAGDRDRLAALASRYGTSEVMVAHAEVEGDPDAGTGSVRVRRGRPAEGGLSWSPSVNYLVGPGEDLAALLARAARTLAGGIESQWKRRNLINFGTKRSIVVSVPIGQLRDWLEVRRRLQNVPSVLASEVVFLKRNRGELSVTFVGDEAQLELALRQSDLLLVPLASPAAAGPATTVIQGGSAAAAVVPGTPSAIGSPGGAPPAVVPPIARWELRLAPASGSGASGAVAPAGLGAAGTTSGAAPAAARQRPGFVERMQSLPADE